MKQSKYIILGLWMLCMAIGLAGCGTKKKVVSIPAAEPEVQGPTWHTCLIQGARATVTIQGNPVSANVTMQTVRDSMLVISVTPMLGLEVMRLEATPFDIIGIDKLHGQYIETTFAELNRRLTPAMNWDILQQLCTAELPTGSERARLVYNFGDDVIELVIVYPARKLDVPVRVGHQRTDKYTKVDISQWL